MREFVPSLTGLLSVCACEHHRSPVEESRRRRGDCAEPLGAADHDHVVGRLVVSVEKADSATVESARDAKGCVAYGLSLNLAEGNPAAAASGPGNPDKVAACKKNPGRARKSGNPGALRKT